MIYASIKKINFMFITKKIREHTFIRMFPYKIYTPIKYPYPSINVISLIILSLIVLFK